MNLKSFLPVLQNLGALPLRPQYSGNSPRIGRFTIIHVTFPISESQKKTRPYFSFAYVRNPYGRIVSCYNNKFNMEDESQFLYSNYLFGYLKNDDSFEDFVKKTSKIPNFLCDRHFKTQFSIIHSRGARMNHIGRMEDLPEDYENIRKRYNFDELKILNKTSGSGEEILLSDETKEIIYDKFEIDFKEFGYSK